MLNHRRSIPIDRCCVKALDLYRFIEKVVRRREPGEDPRKIALGDNAEEILGIAEEENIDLVVAPFVKIVFPLMAGGKLLKMICFLPGAPEAVV